MARRDKTRDGTIQGEAGANRWHRWARAIGDRYRIASVRRRRPLFQFLLRPQVGLSVVHQWKRTILSLSPNFPFTFPISFVVQASGRSWPNSVAPAGRTVRSGSRSMAEPGTMRVLPTGRIVPPRQIHSVALPERTVLPAAETHMHRPSPDAVRTRLGKSAPSDRWKEQSAPPLEPKIRRLVGRIVEERERNEIQVSRRTIVARRHTVAMHETAAGITSSAKPLSVESVHTVAMHETAAGITSSAKPLSVESVPAPQPAIGLEALPAGAVERIADQVMRQLDRRFVALKERLGKSP